MKNLYKTRGTKYQIINKIWNKSVNDLWNCTVSMIETQADGTWI